MSADLGPDPTAVQPGDPARTRFDMYAVEPPPGDWAYILDSFEIKYRRGLVAQRLRRGWWPFAYENADREQRERHGFGLAPFECGVASVRLSPDTEHYSWRNEYLSVGPDREVPHLAHAGHVELWLRKQGMGGMVVPCAIHFDLRTETYEVDGVRDDWPDELVALAHTKGRRALAYLLWAMTERDDGPERPETAHDRFVVNAKAKTGS